jgi:hypothetical protein
MPVGVLIEIPDTSPEIYDDINRKMNVEQDIPDGLLAHTAGEMDGGGMRIFDVWESREQMDRFTNDRLMPAMSAVLSDHGLEQPQDPAPPTVYELHNTIGV